jgi:serine/threonine protein kinase
VRGGRRRGPAGELGYNPPPVRSIGKYRLVEPLASGGMADVWRAEVSGAEGVVKDVALKLVRGEHAEKSAFVRMFVQEARLAARLSHANVVQVFEFDQVGGRYFIAMELVRGRHLGQVTERARERGVRLGVARAVHLCAEVAKALAYAHRLTDGGRPLGLVHRDVSPHNVLVSFEGEVKLADFGIARAMNLSELTDPGTVKGKLAYMAPEQARGGPVDARADVFSLGVVLWELCTGRRLLARESEGATFAVVVGDEPLSPPSTWNEEVPEELDRAVLGALERDPEKRTRSAQELASRLAGVLLRVVRTPEDADLRTFMQRLFPDEIAQAESGASVQEPTRVRSAPVPVAREATEGGRAELAGGEASAPEGTTHTAPSRAGKGRRRVGLAAGAALAVAALAAAGFVMRGATPRASATPRAAATSPATPTAAPTETATPTPASTSTLTTTTTSTSPLPPPTRGRGGEDPPPRPAGEAPGASAAGAERPIEWVQAIGRLRTPRAESGEGILSVNATPWGTVVVNGVVLGESPQELRIRAGRHRVRVDRRNQRGVETVVVVGAGRRTQLLR